MNDKMHVPKVIGIGGERGSGKDTFAQILSDRLHARGVENEILSFADPLKRGLREMMGFTNDQLWGSLQVKETVDSHWGKTPRHYMQYIGTELMRNCVQDDFWLHTPVGPLQQAKRNPHKVYLVPDLRFPNERLAIMGMGGLTLHMQRGEALRGVISVDPPWFLDLILGRKRAAQAMRLVFKDPSLHDSEALALVDPKPMIMVDNNHDLEHLKVQAQLVLRQVDDLWELWS